MQLRLPGVKVLRFFSQHPSVGPSDRQAHSISFETYMDRVSFKARGRIANLISNSNVARTLSDSIGKPAIFFVVSLRPHYRSHIVRGRAFPNTVRKVNA